MFSCQMIVSHEVLGSLGGLRLELLKIRLLGGSDELLSWIANFLTDRKIQVRVRTKAQNRWKFRVGCRKD
jgi:hypothetical protein